MCENSKPDFVPIGIWLDKFEHPLIISGPCSAESESQIVSLAKA